MEVIFPKVGVEMNEQLAKPFGVEEIKVAIHQLFSNKIPGPDGMSPVFYQMFWYVVGDNVVICILNFLNDGFFSLKNINYPYLVLIPKVKN